MFFDTSRKKNNFKIVEEIAKVIYLPNLFTKVFIKHPRNFGDDEKFYTKLIKLVTCLINFLETTENFVQNYENFNYIV
jgi:hypothetical protein